MRRAFVVGAFVVGGRRGSICNDLTRMCAALMLKRESVFEQCAACHSLDGSGDYDGPT
jgi:cytochrome c2